MSSPFNIIVTNIAGETIFSESAVDPEMAMLEFKTKVCDQIGAPILDLGLVWNGASVAPPRNFEKTLSLIFGDAGQGPITLLCIKFFVGEIYFYGLSWGRIGCGISAKKCLGEGDALSNAGDQDRFRKIPMEGGHAFESVSHPGLCMVAEDAECPGSQKLALRKPDGKSEIFREIPAINGDPNKISLESVAYPGRLVCHYYGVMYCHSRDKKLAGDGHYLNDASWHCADAETESEDRVAEQSTEGSFDASPQHGRSEDRVG